MNASTFAVDLSKSALGATLVRLVAPMFMSMVMVASVGLVDAHFIGMLGTDALAAFGLCFPAVMTMQGIMFGLSNGITASMSQARGRRADLPVGEQERLRVRVSIRMGLGLGVLLSLIGALVGPLAFKAISSDAIASLAVAFWFPHLISVPLRSTTMSLTGCMRGFGETRSSAAVLAVSSLLTAALDPLFIFGWGLIPAFGMAGAAIAAVVAYVMSCGYAAVLMHRRMKGAARSGNDGLEPKQVFKEVRAIAVPSALAQILVPAATAVVVAIATRFGTAALAAVAIMQRLEYVVLMVPVATGAGLMPLMGQLFGGGNQRRAAEALRLGRRAMVCWALVIGALLNLAAAPLTALFTDSAEVAAALRIALLFAPILYLGEGLNMTTMSGFNAVGHPMLATKLYLILCVIFVPVLSLLGAQLFGLAGLFGGVASASVTAAALATRWLRIAGLSLRPAG